MKACKMQLTNMQLQFPNIQQAYIPSLLYVNMKRTIPLRVIMSMIMGAIRACLLPERELVQAKSMEQAVSNLKGRSNLRRVVSSKKKIFRIIQRKRVVINTIKKIIKIKLQCSRKYASRFLRGKSKPEKNMLLLSRLSPQKEAMPRASRNPLNFVLIEKLVAQIAWIVTMFESSCFKYTPATRQLRRQKEPIKTPATANLYSYLSLGRSVPRFFRAGKNPSEDSQNDETWYSPEISSKSWTQSFEKLAFTIVEAEMPNTKINIQ